jgi:hypothetical protein
MHSPGLLDGPVPEVRTDPRYAVFRHFSNKRSPDLFLFLRNVSAEELGYPGVRAGHFRLYGFAIEYQTLAPRLLAVYNADRTIEELVLRARGNVRDPARSPS